MVLGGAEDDAVVVVARVAITCTGLDTGSVVVVSAAVVVGGGAAAADAARCVGGGGCCCCVAGVVGVGRRTGYLVQVGGLLVGTGNGVDIVDDGGKVMVGSLVDHSDVDCVVATSHEA